jgi:hypothetical protein
MLIPKNYAWTTEYTIYESTEYMLTCRIGGSILLLFGLAFASVSSALVSFSVGSISAIDVSLARIKYKIMFQLTN